MSIAPTALRPLTTDGWYRMASPDVQFTIAPRFKLIEGSVSLAYDPDEQSVGLTIESDEEIEVL